MFLKGFKQSGRDGLFIILNHINFNMGILDKVHHFFFRRNDKSEVSNFDLKTLQYDLQRRKEIERESEENRANRENKKRPLIIEDGDYKVIREIKWVPDPLVTFGRERRSDGKLADPMLLGVKMFLAEVPYIIKRDYDIDVNNCLNFSKDVQNVATKYGIRCGLVIIEFHRSLTGHAIIAFETDYGLKFFEPQSANEEYVVIGRRYSTNLAGIPDDDIVIKIEISWNDGTHTIIE